MQSQTPTPPRRLLKRLLRVLRGVVVIAALLIAASLAETPIYALRLALRAAPATLPVPVAGVLPRSLRDTWGAARSEGRRHQGIDIFAPRGRPVIASTEGLIWRTGENRLGGTVVWVLGPARQLHYYAHLDRLGPLAAGARVRVGEVIGFVGSTGNARGTPPHLHYGIYTASGPINPYPLLDRPRAAPPTRPPGAS